jgi:phosphatidylethanolamine/phosphatidyl-N-methylethanolamine N-methyltransferase
MQETRAWKVKEGELFFRQWLRSPKSMGSVIPSSQALARAIASAAVFNGNDMIIELGGGTGAITQGLIDVGIPRDRIVVIELDGSMAEFLRARLPGCRVIQGDATRLDELLAHEGVSSIGTVVSGLPMVGMPFEFQQAIIKQGMRVLRKGGTMLQYSYSPLPPVPTRKLDIKARMMKYVFWNFPPAVVWRYEAA